MKIECPSCHLTGNIDDVDLSLLGGHLECPQCKTSFHIDKPSPVTTPPSLMSMCPVCQYSTFTDEMFSICPECGATGTNYREMLLKKSGQKQRREEDENTYQKTPPAEPAPERKLREHSLLTRSLRNPDFEREAPGKAEASKFPIPEPIRLTGWVAIVAGGLSLCLALAGLANYYGKDWQTILSVPLLEPESKVRIFFKVGFFPWLRLIFSACFIIAATQLLALRRLAPTIVSRMSWGGIALILIQEITRLVNRILLSSGSPSLIFYVDCIITLLVTAFFWSTPFLATILLLRRESTLRDYPGE
jgi:hypothetical protein